MFATLNQRWLIDLHEREKRVASGLTENLQPQNWLQKLMHWCKRPT
jgi:hypothetical protein